MADEPAGGAAERTTADLDQLADRLRSRVDLYGKALAAIATLGTGAVGLATVADLAPRGPLSWVWSLGAMAALLVAAWGAVRIAAQLMQVNQPVVLDVDDDLDVGLSPDEQSDLERIYADAAQRFGLSSLQGLAERERGLRRAAARAGSDDERARRTALADEARAEIDHAIARARWAIVRRRAADAAGGREAKRLYVAVAAGLLLFAFLADVATSRQSDNIAVAKACGEARKAGAEGRDLDQTVCEPKAVGSDEDEDGADEPAVPTAEEARAALVAKLAETLKECRALEATTSGTEGSEDRPLEAGECAALTTAIAALLRADLGASAEEPGASG